MGSYYALNKIKAKMGLGEQPKEAENRGRRRAADWPLDDQHSDDSDDSRKKAKIEPDQPEPASATKPPTMLVQLPAGMRKEISTAVVEQLVHSTNISTGGQEMMINKLNMDVRKYSEELQTTKDELAKVKFEHNQLLCALFTHDPSLVGQIHGQMINYFREIGLQPPDNLQPQFPLLVQQMAELTRNQVDQRVAELLFSQGGLLPPR